MFDGASGTRPSPESIAALEEWFERRHPSATAESAGLIERIGVATRVENRAAAAQLVAIGELFAYRLSRCSEGEDWAIDTMAAVAAEVGAALRIGQGLAAGRVHYARAMRERLPRVGAVFAAGDIDFGLFATIVYRTDLITDAGVLAAVDAELAAAVGRWPSLSRGRLSGAVDKIVAKADADAVRRRRQRQGDRHVWFATSQDGVVEMGGSLFDVDARALDKRLDGLAATVCDQDPRSRDQRRADALGALAAGAQRLGCRCGQAQCPAAGRSAPSAVVMHLIAEHPTGGGQALGSQVCAGGLITPELLDQIAASAKLVPLIHPGDAAPEPGYVPSTALADFVRCRDLTCRWPGCEHPAFDCELDHTIPYAQGGPTHAANLKCYCKTHHLIKTFLGWTEKQLPDGTLILTAPSGHTYVTTPGSALLFPSLARAVGGCPAPEIDIPPQDYCAERSAMMPKRRRTRAQDRAQRVAAERRKNREARTAAHAGRTTWQQRYFSPHEPTEDDEPPPF